ncbi:hypothetical protein M3Y94_00191400 [Aphelenchoides besseyi]|nr:hypothetical protein M3Y94_00191400 [Aphelenchoides besseyi]KAI6236790.1 hypothetical protein M3Y95_00195800 [Aphelenchoides besseyi]
MDVMQPVRPRNFRGLRNDLLLLPGLNRSHSDFQVSQRSAFDRFRSKSPVQKQSVEVVDDDYRSTESSPEAEKPAQMTSLRELRIDIPNTVDGYLSSQPNSGSLTPSPKPDVPFEFQLPSLTQSLGPKQTSFNDFQSPISLESHKQTEPHRSTFSEILNLFESAAQARAQKRESKLNRPPLSRFASNCSQSSTISPEEQNDGNKIHKMPRTTRTVTETFSSEDDDRGIVKDIAFQQPQRRVQPRNFPMLKSNGSTLSLNVNEFPRHRSLGELMTSSLLHSPQSDRTLRSPTGSVRSRASDSLFHQMAVSHSSTLAFVSESFPQLLRDYGSPFSGNEVFQNISLANIVFKSTAPTLVKDKIMLFDAAFISPNYVEHPITVLISPAGQYAPLLGRHAERKYGPLILTEFEELESELRHFLHEAGQEQKPMTTLRLQIMPPMNVCSIPSLAAHYLHKNLNPNECERQICFIMIQLLGALKCLQSDGVENLSNNFKEFILSYANPDSKNLLQTMNELPRLMFLRDTMQEEYVDEQQLSPSRDSPSDQQVGVCRVALRALYTLLNRKMQTTLPEIPERTKFSAALRKCASILHLERSSSMSDAYMLLSLAFFATGHQFETEYEAKLWLDEQRAQQVNQIVRLLIQRSPEIVNCKLQMRLFFLLQSTPRTIFRTYNLLKRN